LLTGGVAYQTIVLPAVKYMPLQTFDKLVKLAEAGATVICHELLPGDVPGYGNLQSRMKELANLSSRLVFKNTGIKNIKKAVIGKGSFIIGNDLSELLQLTDVRREPMVDEGLHFVRRKHPAGNYYFISNVSDKKIEGWITLKTSAATVILFDPMFAKSGIGESKNPGKGSTQIYLRLSPGESCIVETSGRKLKGNKFPYINVTGNPEEIRGAWQISFINGGPSLPLAREISGLGSWTLLEGEDVKVFSGIALYRTHFSKPAENADRWLLNLGKVYETAKVILNGETMATLLGPVYEVVIPSSKMKPDNLLEIKVANSMANRITDMDKRGLPWKKFYNVNFPARLSTNRGEDGLFTAAKWQPKVSGLIGPVTITAVSYKR
jgi:hypothetical protein